MRVGNKCHPMFDSSILRGGFLVRGLGANEDAEEEGDVRVRRIPKYPRKVSTQFSRGRGMRKT